MQRPLDESQVLRTNPKIDPRLLKHQQQLNRELQRLGVDARPKYRLLPPLGDTVPRAFHQALPENRRARTP